MNVSNYANMILIAKLTSFAVINIFHGINVPIPWSIKVRYTKFNLKEKRK